MVLLFDGSFQPGDHWVDKNHFYAKNYFPGTYNSCLMRSNSLVVVPAPGGRTGYGGKFAIQSGDHCNTVSDERAMLGYEHYQIHNGDDRWYSVSSYFPAEFSHSTWFLFYQIKTMDGGYPSIALYANPSGQWSLRWDEVNNENIGTFSTGWTDWLIHVKWTTDTTGFVEVYKNGLLVTFHYNVRMIPLRTNPIDWNTRCLVVSSTCKPVSSDFSLSIGAYRGAESATLTNYITNIKIGTTRADV